MNPICDFCAKQEPGAHGGVRCGEATYTYNEGYGPFKQGAVCIYDSDLNNLFVLATGKDKFMLEASKQIERQANMITKLRQENAELRHRLVHIDSAAKPTKRIK